MTHRSTTTRARFALTGVALATACLCASNAWALGLGRLSVQSALGETLRAEIEVTSMTAEEASSLRLRIAPAEAYRAAGVDYNPALPSAQVTLQRRPDGRNVVRIVSDRAVLEPFVDVILEATWASGRLVREYTLLFDPPGSRLAQAPAAPVATMPPQMSPAPALPVPPPPSPPAAVVTSPVQAPPAAPAGVPIPPRAAPAPAASPPLAVRSAPAAPATPAATPPAAAAAPRPSPSESPAAPAAAAAGDQVRVRPGDTLSRIATRVQPAGVSLDQMLVSLFRGNPQAFMGENMNRLKSGAVLTVPDADAVATVPQPQAREIIVAQSADFDAYRRALAAGTPVRAETAPARQAAGQVQAQVDDRRPGAAPTPDKLTLSQGGLRPAEAQDSRATERSDSNARLAELARNVEELKRLQGATAPAASPGAAAPTSTPAAAPIVVAAAPAAAPLPAPAAAPSPPAGPTVAAAPPLPAPRPAPPPAPTPTAAPTAADAEPGLVDDLLQNPLVLPVAGLLVALLAGVGLWRLRKRKKQAGETSFLESRLQPDSFFGASGGQRIDTRDAAPATGTGSSSMSYSLSQLDAIGDVDPVAEADVYLAYGRDLQAEEILKEAMRSTPDRMAIRIKLLEVYAKRRDSKGFELLATQVYSLTAGQGDDWTKAQSLGLGIDPDNALYQPGGRPGGDDADDGPPIDALGASTIPHTAPVGPPAFVPAADATLDGDLDLDLDLGGPVNRDSARAGPDSVPPDFGLDTRPAPPETTRALSTATDLSVDSGLDFDLSQAELSGAPATGPGALDATPPASAFAPLSAESGSADNGLDFDLGDLGDLGAPGVATPPPPPPANVDLSDFPLEEPGVDGPATDEALARKLELAEEFRQIGDLEGARDLLEEVVARAEGALRVKAQGMLEQLG